MNHVEQFLSARRASTPLVMITTPDPAITISWIRKAVEDKKSPIITWDCINGMVGLTDADNGVLMKAIGSNDPDDVKAKTTNATESLELARKLPDKSILIFMNAHQGFDPPNPNYIQAIWNLRDLFKVNRRQLVLLTPGCTLPRELAQDISTIDEPLPDSAQLESLVSLCFKGLQAEVPEGIMPKAIDALCGLASFPAEQVASMAFTRDKEKEGKPITLNIDRLWDRKRQIIEQAPGLSVYRGTEKFCDIGGLDNAKSFFTKVLNGREKPRAIVFCDEVEKGFAGATAGTSDTSGVAQGFLGTILQEMQDNGYSGLIGVGFPGAGKSMIAKAIGNEGGIPTITLDLGALKGSLVGQSEANLRQAMKVIKAVSQGKAFWFATCNRVAGLPPELRRRFSYGIQFFDLPSDEERAAIWKLYMKTYELEGAIPNDEGWTGAEIRTCCDLAWKLNCSMIEAAAYIVPVAIAASEQIRELREQAHGRYISASYPGVYRNVGSETQNSASRMIDVEEE